MSMTDLAPVHLEWCLAYWTRSNPRDKLGEDHFNSSVGQEVLTWLRTNGLIDGDDRATDKLGAYVQHLCRQPLPVAKWVVIPEASHDR